MRGFRRCFCSVIKSAPSFIYYRLYDLKKSVQLIVTYPDFMEQWTEQLQSENLLEGYRAEKFIEYTDEAEPLTEMDTDFMLKTLDHIKVFED